MEALETVKAMLSDKVGRAKLKRRLAAIHPRDVAGMIKRLDPAQKLLLFLLLDVDQAADVLLALDETSLSIVLKGLDKPDLSRLVAELESDEAADILAAMSDADKAAVLTLLPGRERKALSQLLGYPEETAGGRMKLEFLPLYTDETVTQALRRIRTRKPEYGSYFFVTDRYGHLLGWVSPLDLIANSPRQRVGKLMHPCKFYARVTDDQEVVARLATKYDVATVPVVDDLGVLKGIITQEDIVEVIEEEATEDVARLGHSMEVEGAFVPVRRSLKGRLPWLYLNLIGAFVAAMIVGAFEGTLRTMIAVAAFMPVIAEMGGAAGSQVVGIIVRSIALGEIEFADARRLLWKEVRVGLLTGVTSGALTAVMAILLRGSPLLGLIVFGAVILNMLLGVVVGLMVPMLLARFRCDPAMASGLLLTAITDAGGLLALLGLASLAVKIFGMGR